MKDRERESHSAVSPTLCDPVDYSPPDSVHGILQARILPFPSPGDIPDPGIKPGSPELQADSLPSEPPGSHVLSCVCPACVPHASQDRHTHISSQPA